MAWSWGRAETEGPGLLLQHWLLPGSHQQLMGQGHPLACGTAAPGMGSVRQHTSSLGPWGQGHVS